MPKDSSRFSRRSFVEHSTLAAGFLGALGQPSSRVGAAEATDAAALAAASGVNARQHGAKANGKTDDTKTLQAALDAAATKGPVCYLPAGVSISVFGGVKPGRHVREHQRPTAITPEGF